MSSDSLWLILSYVYVTLVILLGTLARSGGRRPPDVTRKIIHVGVGTWIIPTTVFFTSRWMAVVPPLTFVLLNILSYRFRAIRAMEEGERNPGTIYFPLAFVILILVFWTNRFGAPALIGLFPGHGVAYGPDHAAWYRLPVAAGIMAMAWGDAAASVLGRRFGRRLYSVPGGERKSLEGSLAFFGFAFAGIAVAAAALGVCSGFPPAGHLGPRPWALWETLGLALPAAAATALVEGVTPRGLDNLTVPLTGAVVVRLLMP